MCVTGRIAKGKAMHTHSFSFLLCHSQLCLLAIIFFQFVLIDISARFSLILLPFFCSCRLAVITSFLMSFPPHLFCLYLLYIWFPLSPSFTLLGTKTPTSPPPSFFSLFLLPPPFHIHRLPTALLSLPPLVLPSTRVPLLMLLAVYLCVSV